MDIIKKKNVYASPEKYIQDQPLERQEALQKLRGVIQDNLPSGFEETMAYQMISYVVPHTLYPKGYHVNPKEPLPFLSLANQKGFLAIYHLGLYQNKELFQWFSKEYALLNIGKLDMGKSCIRLKKIEQIPYALIGELCRKMTVSQYIEGYERARNAQVKT